MIGISAPFAFHEAVMAQASATTGIFTTDNLDRLRTLLAQAGLEEAESGRLATPGSLRAGQAVLRRECVECHDLRTVLAKPRTPQNWRQTVRRMADRTTQLDPLEENEQWLVTAYLIAISPQLQRSAQQMRAQEELGNRAKQAMQAVAHEEVPSAEFDLRQAKGLFETKCSECHETSLVETAPPGSAGEARSLVARMVDEGLTATETELAQLVKYLTTVYAKPVPAARENDR